MACTRRWRRAFNFERAFRKRASSAVARLFPLTLSSTGSTGAGFLRALVRLVRGLVRFLLRRRTGFAFERLEVLTFD